jgi:hypothetical protein
MPHRPKTSSPLPPARADDDDDEPSCGDVAEEVCAVSGFECHQGHRHHVEGLGEDEDPDRSIQVLQAVRAQQEGDRDTQVEHDNHRQVLVALVATPHDQSAQRAVMVDEVGVGHHESDGEEQGP